MADEIHEEPRPRYYEPPTEYAPPIMQCDIADPYGSRTRMIVGGIAIVLALVCFAVIVANMFH